MFLADSSLLTSTGLTNVRMTGSFYVILSNASSPPTMNCWSSRVMLAFQFHIFEINLFTNFKGIPFGGGGEKGEEGGTLGNRVADWGFFLSFSWGFPFWLKGLKKRAKAHFIAVHRNNFRGRRKEGQRQGKNCLSSGLIIIGWVLTGAFYLAVLEIIRSHALLGKACTASTGCIYVTTHKALYVCQSTSSN